MKISTVERLIITEGEHTIELPKEAAGRLFRILAEDRREKASRRKKK